ncbi:MAG: phosphoglycolate phosphatase [Caulobacteraceae bacterium]
MRSQPPPLAGASVIFDLDGTLVDTAADLVGTLNSLLAEEGVAPLPLAQARPMIGRGARVLIARGYAAAGLVVDETRAPALLERFIAAYRERIAVESVAFEGAGAALGQLAAAGARLAVCTNKPTGLSLDLLAKLDLLAYFTAVVGPEFTPAPKPDPRHLLAAIARTAGRADRAVMVGDSAADAAAARAAGTALVLTSFGYSETPAADLAPDALLDKFADLPRVCIDLLQPVGSG